MSNVFSNLKVFSIKNPSGTLVGNGSVDVAGVVNVRFTIVKGQKGVFVSLPSRPGKKPDENGKTIYYKDVKILNEDLEAELQNLVTKEFAKVLQGPGKPATAKVPVPQPDTEDEMPF